MPVTRKEPNDPMTYKEYGQTFATDTLIDEIEGIEVGETVEIDYEVNGIETSKVGTVSNVDRTEDSTDIDIRTGGPREAYLHVNKETADVFFAPDNRKRSEVKLLLFDRK